VDFGAANLRDNGGTFGSVALRAKSRFLAALGMTTSFFETRIIGARAA
jgi:hypothetical protein